MKQSKFRLHFVGIGGIGMSGIAKVFANQGYPVTGSDLSESDMVRELRNMGIQIFIGHRTENVGQSDVIVISSAVKADNPEVVEAKKRRIPVIPRAEMLGELMRGKIGVAIAGTHGKTTTTSMVASILTEADMDPTSVIGGKVGALGGNARLGKGSVVVAEADESDGSFLHLPATFGVITNIDNDHLDHYGTMEAVEKAFVDFVGRIPFYGLVNVCLDDPIIERLIPAFIKPFTTYGTNPKADFVAKNIQPSVNGFSFDLCYREKKEISVQMHVPGKHNVLNAVAAAGVCRHLGVEWEKIQKGLEEFRGADRRFQTKWKTKDQWVVDDYGHHPTEILATLEAARSVWKGRILCVFQPHRYSRTESCWDAFLNCFEKADTLFVTDIYPAGEKPIPGITTEKLVTALKGSIHAPDKIEWVKDLDSARDRVLKEFTSGDLVLTLGAGSITKLSDQLKEALES